MANQFKVKNGLVSDGDVIVSGSITATGGINISGSIASAETASFAPSYTLTSSFNSYTSSASSSVGSLSSSIATTTSNLSSSIGSLSGSVATTTSNLSSSIGSLSSSVATTTLNLSSSVSSSIGSLSGSIDTTTSGLASRIGSIETKTGSYATTGSNIFVGSQVITGSLYITTDLVVQGCSCLQNITASAVSIGTNTVILNTATPAVRFAGISVQDSGSNAGVTGSIFWDGLCNKWVYSNPSGIGYSGGMLLSGPRTSTLGSETPLTCNYIAKSGGGDHLYDSCIIDDGTTVCVNATLKGSGQVCSVMGTFSCLGIGTTSPTYGFEVNTSKSKLYNVVIGGTTSGCYCSYSDSIIGLNNLHLSATGSGAVFINTTTALNTNINPIGGCVGIGTNSPLRTLHISNTTAADPVFIQSNQTYSVIAFASSTNACCVTVGVDGAGSASFENKDVNKGISLVTGLNTRFGICSNGVSNFSCQVCTPLIVTTQQNIFTKSGKGTSEYAIRIGPIDYPTEGLFLGHCGLTNDRYIESYGGPLYINSTGNELRLGACAVNVTGNGCVGIGTTSPGRTFEVYSCSADRGGFIRSSNCATVGVIPSYIEMFVGGCAMSIATWRNSGIIEAVTTCGMVLSSYCNNIVFQVGSRTEMMRITNVGVGINTQTIDANVSLQIGCSNGTTNGQIRIYPASSIYEGNIYATSTYSLYLDTDSNLRPIRVDGSCFIIGVTGNVGVGTTTPYQKLVNSGHIALTTSCAGTDSTADVQRSGIGWQACASDQVLGAYMTAANQGNWGSDIQFFTRLSSGGNASERFRITNSGIACFAGIVCSPTILVSGCIGVGSQNTVVLPNRLNVTEDNSPSFLGIYRNNVAVSQEMGGVQWTNGGAGTQIAKISVFTSSDYTDTSNIGFYTRASGGSQSEKLRITSGGVACFASTVCAGGMVALTNQSFGNPATEAAFRIRMSDNGGINNDPGIGLDGASGGGEVMWFNALNGFYFNMGTYGAKVQITSAGAVCANSHILPMSNGTQDLGSSSLRWCTVYTSDLSLNNGIGNYTIVEGENDLFLYNNNSCKVFKFLLQEVCKECAPAKRSI